MKTNEVCSQEGQAENALSGGLFTMAYEREIATLDSFVNKLASEYPLLVKPKRQSRRKIPVTLLLIIISNSLQIISISLILYI